ncbi:restriction endonuclease subunit S [Croceibacter atlanticus]|uniref:restriction endonuclease subunit S n=1 Tax=Croceibacter atlanticus TaxID=313588 RepID=UPI001C606F49|nr:restriction endonuclease subunit S [Croceibacter atlanticus]MBW4969035.1 restriction endonuclease subunit S [Croceibacter atlanticus]
MTETYNNSTLVKEGYKETKLGLIPKDWTTPTISEVFDFLKTTSFSRNQLSYDDENKIFYIHYGDIHATFKKPLLDFEIEANVPKLNDNVTLPNNVQYLKDGDVIIADASEDYDGVGEAIEIKNLNGKTAISGLHTFALRDIDNKTVPGFRTYIFKNPIVKKALKTIATGSKVYGISKSNTQKFKIVLPTLPEQQKIASILNTWDKAIAAQEQLIAQKQALKKGLMQQLLTGKKRFAGFSGEWKKMRFTEFSELFHGFQFRKEHFVENGYPVIKIGSLVDSKGLTIDNATYISEKNAENFESFRLYEGDVLMALTGGTLGKVAIVDRDYGKIFQNYRVGKFIPKGNCTKLYLSQLLQSFYVQQRVKSLVNEAAQPNFGKQDFNKIWIPLPPIEEQKQIASFLIKFDAEVKLMVSRLDSLKKQKQGLMQQLLTGVKRVYSL